MVRERLEVRVGTDVQSIDDVADSMVRFGERYLKRIYTEHEVDSCGGLSALAAPHLTARFAAKEATMKLLRPTDDVPGWKTIEVRRQPGGWCELSLSGRAQQMAEEAGFEQLSLSISHDDRIATATVVGLRRTGRRS